MTAPMLFPLLSTSADELRRTASRQGYWVQTHDDVALPDPAYTLARWRGHRPELTEASHEVADGDAPYHATEVT
jgi:polyketide synthase 5